MLSRIARRVISKLDRSAKLATAKARVRLSSRHLSGSPRVTLREDEVALVCMLKNGSYYLDGLLEHHRKIGIRHFLFIDNGSEDDTVDRLANHADVTVISNHLPVRKYESLLRADIARRLIKGGWLLFVDSDELIEMMNGDGRSISDYARYCNENGYDAVVGQCLDLFPMASLVETASWPYSRSIRDFCYYSLGYISEFGYHDRTVGFEWFLRDNTVSNPDIRLKFGGIRRELFNENCALTNHRMVKNAAHIKIYSHPHCSSNVHCADFTLLLRHYKFAGNFLQRELQQVREKTWDHGEDKSRMAVMTDPGFTFSAKQIQRFSGTGPLIEQGFLTGSERFFRRFPSPGPHQTGDLS